MSRTFRNPVAGKKFLRNPKTQSEKRAYMTALEDGVRVRAKRNPKNLVDSYDDLIISAGYEIRQER